MGSDGLVGPVQRGVRYGVAYAGQVADPFHVVKLANGCLYECRRRGHVETLGHRSHKDDAVFRCRKLLVMTEERVDVSGRAKVQGLLRAGEPQGEVDYA